MSVIVNGMQVAYNQYMDDGYEGDIVDLRRWTNISRAAEEKIPFGKPVKRGTDKSKQVKIWADAINVPVLGFAARTLNQTKFTYTKNNYNTVKQSETAYQVGEQVTVIIEGTIKLRTPEEITADDVGKKAYLKANDGALTKTEADNLYIGTFEKAAAVDGITEIFLDIKRD